MDIIETSLPMNRQARKRNTTNRIIIHHSVSGDVSAQTIHDWHLARGWLGIGYHFVIRQDGTVERGRAEDTVGAHAGSTANGDSIGVCVVGNFEKYSPSSIQLLSLVKLIKDYLIPKYGALDVERHADHMATACPGSKFPWKAFLRRLKEVESMDWQDEQAINMLYSLGNMGLLNDPEQHVEKIKSGEPVGDFVLLSLIERIAKQVKGVR